jgi:hypothetical protein
VALRTEVDGVFLGLVRHSRDWETSAQEDQLFQEKLECPVCEERL